MYGWTNFQTSFLLSMRDGVQRQQIDLTLAAATFVTGIMKFYKQVSVMNICFTKLMTYWELMNLNYTFHSPLILGSVTMILSVLSPCLTNTLTLEIYIEKFRQDCGSNLRRAAGCERYHLSTMSLNDVTRKALERQVLMRKVLTALNIKNRM